MKHVEILAPAGDFETLKVAIDAGCNAVYFAGKNFGARSFAPNFDNDEIVNAIKYCHLYNVKAFITVNTVIFEDEINDAVKYLDFLNEAGCDAVIVQDLGLASIIKHRYPDMRLHASTQINAQTIDDVLVLKKLGFDRVILGREVSLDTIKKIKDAVDIEIEVFAHGALCISYSGACYISSFLKNRSGNRGKCSQLCRMPFSFNGRRKYYLSPKDLCTISSVEKIAECVDSIKIEGRMKSKEYVYSVINSYYKALNNTLSKEEINNAIYQMKISFNRGYTNGFILNTKNSELTNVKKSNHQGVLIGKVVNSYKNEVTIKLDHDLYFDDSIRFTIDDNELDAVNVNNMYVSHVLTKCAKSGSLVNLKTHKDIALGASCYLTKRENLNLFGYTPKKIELTGFIESTNNAIIIGAVLDGIKFTRKIEAEKTEKDFTESYKKQMDKTKDTPFVFTSITGSVKGKFAPLSKVNEARRELTNDLIAFRENVEKRRINDSLPVLSIKESDTKLSENLVIYDSSLERLENFKLDFSYDAFDRNCEKGRYFYPRVTMKKYDLNKGMFTNLGNISFINSPYTNITNSFSVRVLESLGVNIVTLSVEISKNQIKKLVSNYTERYGKIPNLALMVYGHIELMYMRHCFINKEKGYQNKGCGECKKDILFDENFPVYGDLGCSLSLLSFDVLNITKFKDDLKMMNIKHFIYDFTKTTKDELLKMNDSGGYYGHYLDEI